MKIKKRKNKQLISHGYLRITREEIAALELLKSTGVPIIEAAQVACTTVKIAKLRDTPEHGIAERAQQVLYAGLKMLEQQEHTVTLQEAAWASLEARKGLRPTTKRDLRHFVRRILRVKELANKHLRSFTTADCKRILTTAFGSSPSSYKKGRAIFSSIFSFGIRNEWVDSNPVSRIEIPRIQEKPIDPLTVEEVKKLHQAANSPKFKDMRFSLILMLYGGIRPAEVSRLQSGDINWEEGQVIIRSHTSKTGGGRAVPLRGIRGISKRDCSIPRNWKRKWKNLRRAAGFLHWVPDICRHTFASYHATMFCNLPQLQLEMGHRDTSLLRSRYITPTGRKEAELFWKGAVR